MKIHTYNSWHLRRAGGLFLGLRVQFPVRVWITKNAKKAYRLRDHDLLVDMTTVSFGFLFWSIHFQICTRPEVLPWRQQQATGSAIAPAVTAKGEAQIAPESEDDSRTETPSGCAASPAPFCGQPKP